MSPNGNGAGAGSLQRPSGPGSARVIPFGKYLLLDRLAIGGMAEVYTAKSFGIEGFEKIIAIKRILPAMAEDDEFIQMFIDEAKIAGHLTHANIVPIYELGKIGESHYIAMEYVWGKDLLQIMNRFRRMRRHMPPAMAAWIASKMCEALDFAHRKNDRQGRPLHIVHRDISPQNILVSYEGQVKLIDFGIAKAAARNTKTQAGVLKGKFGYMSPEQVRSLPIDARSDLFAVGTCMHEMLTGERLFAAESDFSTLEKVRNADVIPPSVSVPDLPKALEEIVMKALAREASDRFASAADMQQALQNFVAEEKPPFGTTKLASWMRTAFAAEMNKEKMRLDSFASVVRPATASLVPLRTEITPPPSVGVTGSELELDSTALAALELAPESPEELPGAPTEIFFSAEDPDSSDDVPTTTHVPDFDRSRPPRSQPPPDVMGPFPVIVSAPAPYMPIAPGVQPGIGHPAIPHASTSALGPDTLVHPKAPSPVGSPSLGAGVSFEVSANHAATTRRARMVRLGIYAGAGMFLLLVLLALVMFGSRDPGGTIEVRTNPPIAGEVWVDGVLQGETPLRLAGVPRGQHHIEVRVPGYVSTTRFVPLESGEMHTLEFGLVPESARERPSTSAEAVRDAPTTTPSGPPPPAQTPTPSPEQTETAPRSTPLAEPDQPTHAAAAEPEEQRVSAPTPRNERTSRDSRRSSTLARRPSEAPSPRPSTSAQSAPPAQPAPAEAAQGYLVIETRPWARVVIDGRDTGQNTPVRRLAVSPGRHTVGLRTSDGRVTDVPVNVAPGQTLQIMRQL